MEYSGHKNSRRESEGKRIMKKRLRKRLSSESGESIAEVLIALLIAAVALMMLASMISSTVSIVNKSKTKMDEYYQNNAVLELQATPSATPALETSTTLTIKTTELSSETVEETAKVYLFENDTFHKKVYAYQSVK